MASKEQQVKNSIVYLFAIVAGNLVSILTLPIFTRIIPREDYGALALAQAYAIVLGGIAHFGLAIIYERNFFEHREPKKAAALLYSTLAFAILWSFIFAFGTYLARGILAQWLIGSFGFGALLFWAFCANGIMSLKAYYLTYYKNTENAKKFVWYTIDEIVLASLVSLFFVVVARTGVIGIVWGQFMAGLVVFATLSVRFLKIHPLSFNWALLKDSLRLAYPLSPRLFLGVMGNYIDKYTLRFLNSVGGVGIYSIGQKMANVSFAAMTAIQNVYAPQVYKKMFMLEERGKEEVGRYLTPFVYLSFLVALLIGLLAEELVWMFLAPAYHDATGVVIILSMFYGVMFFGKQPQLLFAKKTLMISLLTFVNLGLTVAITIPFIVWFGMIGAAWGALVSGVVSVAISFLVSQHSYRIGWEYKKIGTLVCIFFISLLGLFLLRVTDVEYFVRLLWKVAALVAYGISGVRFRILTREYFAVVKRMIQREHISPPDV